MKLTYKSVVEELAKIDPIVEFGDYRGCSLCWETNEHEDNCPWLMARQMLFKQKRRKK